MTACSRVLPALALLLASCSSTGKVEQEEVPLLTRLRRLASPSRLTGKVEQEEDAPLLTLAVTTPNGKTIRVETAIDPDEQERGLMFRKSLAPDRGMLFIFAEPDRHPFFMYHTLIPLDIIWMDSSQKIVFISRNTPPCPSEKPAECPNYGGSEPAQFVLEIPGGAAASYGIKEGDRLQF